MKVPSFERTPTVAVSSSLEAQKGADRVQDVAAPGITGVAAAFLVLAVLVLVDHARPIQVQKHWARAFIWATQLHSLARSSLLGPSSLVQSLSLLE